MLTYIKSLLITVFFALLGTTLFAQNELAIGEWRSHLPYRCFKYLTQSPTTLYCATAESLMMMDKEERSVEFMSTVDGLSNTGMGIIKYNEANDVLIATYENSVFDLITPTQVITFEDIKTDGNFGDRTIYDIHIHDNDFAYFSCGFGVVKFDLKQQEFIYTADFGIRINALTVFNNVIYAATEEGVYYISNDEGTNFQDLSKWTLLDVNDGFPAVYSSIAIASFNNQLYLDVNGVLNRFNNGVLTPIYEEMDFTIKYLTSEGDNLILGLTCGADCNGKTFIIDNDEVVTALGFGCTSRPLYAIEDSQNRVWLADNFRGLRLSKTVGENCETFEFDSPLTVNSSEVAIYKNDIYIASGGVNSTGSFAGRSDGFC